jgi:ABC-type lipoprotein export system ATPase subunit
VTAPETTANDTVVDVQNVSRKFEVGSEEIWAVRNASLTVYRGEFVALIGRSGSGKTTLLNLIAGLDQPTAGTVIVNGMEISAFNEPQLTELRRHTIGFVFQSFGLLPLLSAYENVEIAMRIAGTGLRERRRRTTELIDLVGLTGRANHRPFELSGGEQQRVAIARALANQPSIVLADEPTGELDSSTAVDIFNLLRDLVRLQDVTIITTTHDRTVMEMVGRVEEMRDGRILPPDEHELLQYTTSDQRSHFAAELPEGVREDVAAATVRAPERRHVVIQRELPAEPERRTAVHRDDRIDHALPSKNVAPPAGAMSPDADASDTPPNADAVDAPTPEETTHDFSRPSQEHRPDWAQRDDANGPDQPSDSRPDGA